MTDTTTANIILQQIGGNKFLAMTGAKHLIALENGLMFDLGRNASKANKVKITVNSLDLYDVEFIKYTPYKFNVKTMTERKEKVETVETLENYYGDMLQDGFTIVTGLYTHL